MKKFFILSLILLIGGSVTKGDEHPDYYNRISMSFRNVNFTGASGYIGGSFNYTHGFSLSSRLPIYLETGGALSYVGKDVNGNGWDTGYGTIEVPVNATYRLTLPSSSIVFYPSLGLNFKGNIVGSSNMSRDTQEWFNDYDFKRFQLGWQLGVGMEYKKLFLGISFGTDFVQIGKKVNTNTLAVSFGLNI